jgi:hypothetical protein
MTQSATPEGRSLQAIGRRLRATMNASDSGPLLISGEVVQLSLNWENYRRQAEGRSCSRWLRDEISPGRGLYWFQARNTAARAIGSSAHRLHHEAAVWLVSSVPEGYRIAVISRVNALFRGKNNGACITKGQVTRIAAEVQKKVPQARVCARCKRLAEQIRQMGGTPEE